jgi:hypothetical protein
VAKVVVALSVAFAVAGSASGAVAGGGIALPRTGIAVETGRGVALVDIGGRVRRFLPGFSLREGAVERPGQVELRDRAGKPYELRAGALVRVPSGSITLEGGYSLRFGTHWTLRHGTQIVERIRRFTHVELDSFGSVLSVVPGHFGAATAGVARDLRTGKTRTLLRGCRVGARSGRVEYDLCGYPYVQGQPSMIVRSDQRGRRTLVGPAEHQPHGPAGWWQSVSLAPDGRTLLAQWSGECEVPTAYRIDTAGGRMTILGRSRSGQPVESRTLGWNGSEALVALPHSLCTGSAEEPGIYAFKAGQPPRLVYRLPTARQAAVRLWK